MKMSKTLLVFLHGSGGNGPELRAYLDTIPLAHFGLKTFRSVAAEKSIEYICPTAGSRPYTPAMGQNMNVWFDRSDSFMRKGYDDPAEDIKGANYSVNQIIELVSSKQASYTDIFIGGFSQGGCLSLHLLRDIHSSKLPAHVRGIFSMGSFLVKDSAVLSEQRVKGVGPQCDLPVFMMHGDDDSLIRVEWGNKTATSLLLKDRDVHFKSYPDVDHEICDEGLVDLIHWIDDVTAKNTELAAIRARTQQSNSTDTMVTGETTLIQTAAMEVDQEYKSVVVAVNGVTLKAHRGSQNGAQNGVTNGVTNGAHRGDAEHPYVPYELKQLSAGPTGGQDVTLISFSIPLEMVTMATASPILAVGGLFELKKSDQAARSHNGETVLTIHTEVTSSDPHYAAQEIGKRIYVRLGSNGASLRACPMS